MPPKKDKHASSDGKDAHAADVNAPVSSLSTLAQSQPQSALPSVSPALSQQQPLPAENRSVHDRLDVFEHALKELRGLFGSNASFAGYGERGNAVEESAFDDDKDANTALDALPHADIRPPARGTLLTGLRLAQAVTTESKSAARGPTPQSSSSARADATHVPDDQSLDDTRMAMIRTMTDLFRARPARVPIQEQRLAPSIIAGVKAKKGKFAVHAERKWSSGARKVEAMSDPEAN